MGKRFAALMTACFSVALTVAAPLTTEDVVRLFAAGESTESIVAIVERSEPGFDLSPGMLQELRAAHVPENVIRSMQLRQQRATPLAADLDEELADRQPTLGLTLEGTQLSLRRSIPESAAIGLDLPNTEEGRTFTDLAIYIVCVSPEHVPERWRNHSPLGRDFDGMPRHRLIGFHSAGNDDYTRKLRFELPGTIDLVLAEDAPHDLLIGIAAHVGGAFRHITDDLWPGVTAEAIDTGLRASARGNSLTSFHVEFTNKPLATATPEIKRSREP